MKLKYNRSSELEVVGFGIFKPKQVLIIENEVEAKRYLDSGYFNKVKEKKRKPKYKPNILELDVKKKAKKYIKKRR